MYRTVYAFVDLLWSMHCARRQNKSIAAAPSQTFSHKHTIVTDVTSISAQPPLSRHCPLLDHLLKQLTVKAQGMTWRVEVNLPRLAMEMLTSQLGIHIR